MATILNDKMGITLRYKDLIILENSLKKKIKIKIQSLKRNLKKNFEPNDGCVDLTKSSIENHGRLYEKIKTIRISEDSIASKTAHSTSFNTNFDWNENDSDIFIYHLINEHFFTMIDSTLDNYLIKTRKVIDNAR